jgi:protein-arginine kinase activator protein McsA
MTTCEVCEEHEADRTVTVLKTTTGHLFSLRVCPRCALWIADPEGIDQLPVG